LGQDAPPPAPPGIHFGQAVERYLQAKSRKKSIQDDTRHLTMLRGIFGAQWEVLLAVPKIRTEKEAQGRSARPSSWGSPGSGSISAAAFRLEGFDRRDGTRTKSAKRREVPMRQAVYDLLSARPEPREGRVWRQRRMRTAFEHAVKAARIGDFVFHDCRHHFASWFVMRGGSLRALQEILGHADLKMTLRYAHLAPEHLRQEMAKTEGPIAAGFSTQSAQRLGATVDSGSDTSEVPESLGAEGGTRTPTPLRAHDPESCASANSATSARARPPSYGPRV
jgi:hypothetical protein